MNQCEMQWKAKDGTTLFARVWEPNSSAKGVICLVHGLGEHSGRYHYWADKLTSAGFALLTFDLRGHGRSGGKRGDTPSYNHFADDIDILLNQAAKKYPDTPTFLYGHSLGGMLTLYYLIKNKPVINGAVVTSPGLRTMLDQQKVKVTALRILEPILPKLTIPNGLELEGLSRDESVVKNYIDDPLVHDHVSLRMGKGMIDTIDFIFANASKVDLPLLLMHGSGDRITYHHGSEEFAEKVNSKCTLKIWDGLYHELHNEPEKDQVFDYLLDWLHRHQQTQQASAELN